MTDYLRVGVITSPHGVKGEVNVFPTTDDANRFKKLKKVYIDTKKGYKECDIESVKFFKQMVILKFKGLDNRNDIEGLRNMDLLVDRENAVKLKPNENFICDLIDCEVFTDEDVKIGIIKDVMITGANDVYVVENDDCQEILIPVIKDCVLDVDIDSKKIVIKPLPGLLDIYLN